MLLSCLHAQIFVYISIIVFVYFLILSSLHPPSFPSSNIFFAYNLVLKYFPPHCSFFIPDFFYYYQSSPIDFSFFFVYPFFFIPSTFSIIVPLENLSRSFICLLFLALVSIDQRFLPLLRDSLTKKPSSNLFIRSVIHFYIYLFIRLLIFARSIVLLDEAVCDSHSGLIKYIVLALGSRIIHSVCFCP